MFTTARDRSFGIVMSTSNGVVVNSPVLAPS